MVLLDSTHEEVWLRFQEALAPDQWAEFEALTVTNQDLLDAYPEAERWYTAPLADDATTGQVRQARKDAPLRPMPLIVLAHDLAGDESRQPPLLLLGRRVCLQIGQAQRDMCQAVAAHSNLLRVRRPPDLSRGTTQRSARPTNCSSRITVPRYQKHRQFREGAGGITAPLDSRAAMRGRRARR